MLYFYLVSFLGICRKDKPWSVPKRSVICDQPSIFIRRFWLVLFVFVLSQHLSIPRVCYFGFSKLLSRTKRCRMVFVILECNVGVDVPKIHGVALLWLFRHWARIFVDDSLEALHRARFSLLLGLFDQTRINRI